MKNMSYQEKFMILKPWIEEIIEVVKRDLKNEHLAKDKVFCRRYFLGKNPSGVDLKCFSEAYLKDIEAGNTGLAEFIATRWLLKHPDIYEYFEGMLKKITVDFENLEELDQDFSKTLISESSEQFGVKNTYIFSIFNSVVFPPSFYVDLKDKAEKFTCIEKKEKQTKQEKETFEEMQKRYERELKAAKDRFEKKISGLQKKYIADTENLKKRISVLEKQIHG